ncbi:MAG TPA: phage recombination protein Bet [Candidatus Binatia bacterium]|nr:phage recombination protein Bet [Candidatus Binatia bacterium]
MNKAKTKSKPKPKRVIRFRRRNKRGAIVLHVPQLPEHRYALKADQIELIKRTIAKGASDEELALFLAVARRHRLDPFTRQLHLVPRWDKHLVNADGSKGGYVRIIQIGIDGYRQMASRYPDFGSISDAEYGEIREIAKTGIKAPEWARIRVYKKGLAEPSVGTAYWPEFMPNHLLNEPGAFLWKRMPKHMLAKCAEALALRKAYPDLADIYTKEELTAANLEATSAGRIVVHPNDPSLRQDPAVVSRELASHYNEETQKKIEQRATDVNEQPIPTVFYVYYEDRHIAEITGPRPIMEANRDLFVPLWVQKDRAVIANDNQLESLKFELEKRGVPFHRLKQA